ncbi:unnamed protein product [Arctogadus glacialis]
MKSQEDETPCPIPRVSKKRAKLALGTNMSQVLAAQDVGYVGSADVLLLEAGSLGAEAAQDVGYVGSADVLLLEAGSLGAEAGPEEGDEVAVGEVLTR